MIDEVKWQDSYITENSQMNLQHQHILDVINSMISARNRGDLDYVIDKVTGDLDHFMSQHMNDEEVLIKQHGTPEGKQHIKIHLDIAAQYEKYKYELVDSNSKIDEFLYFIKDGITNHISTEDTKLGLKNPTC